MDIIKVFSDPYDEERIYSVLMDEEELVLFSEIQREFTGEAKLANKIAKRNWEKGLGQRKGLKKLLKGELPSSEAIAEGRKKNKSRNSYRGYFEDKNGNRSFRNLNHKINEKAEGASLSRLDQGYYTGVERGVKSKGIGKGYDREVDFVKVGEKFLTPQEFRKPNVIGKVLNR